jgi:hypothetical protein
MGAGAIPALKFYLKGVFMTQEGQVRSAEKQSPPIEVEKPVEEERYHVIKIKGKQHEHEVEIVHVVTSSNPRTNYDYRMRRGVLIPVPECVCEVLDQAKHPQFRQPTEDEMVRGVKEKIVSYIERYSYEKIFKDIPKDVYLVLKKRATDPNAKPLIEKEIQDMLSRRKS